jgi:bacillolysin
MQRFMTIALAIAMAFPVFGQMKPRHEKIQRTTPLTPENLTPPAPVRPGIPPAANPFFQEKNFKSIPQLPKPVKNQPSLKAFISPETGTPYLIEGSFDVAAETGIEMQAQEYLAAVQPVLGLKNPAGELIVHKIETDELGFTHVRFRQMWKGVPVYGAEAVLHKNQSAFYFFNGRFFPTPELADVTPSVAAETAADVALSHVSAFTKVKNLTPMELKLSGGEQTLAELVVYHADQKTNAAHLAWHVTVVPNITARYSYFIDAKTGEVLNYHSELCQIAGHFNSENHRCTPSTVNVPPPPPTTANANDLLGQTRLINTYQQGNTYYLMDASQTMFKPAQSTFPDDPVGVIWTIDAQNTSPENNNFAAAHITSSNNSWANPKAISAHYHGEKAYDYFKNTFNRESINGQGGNIISLINVVENDNSQMDNAFWNGYAMFYGNGNQAFSSPLAKALDVAGHEMSHGVIQATANLEYLGESGALNESFADVFGAMIDRNDWQVGEDIVNFGVFPSGALRDLSNPHNGGSGLNSNGWQPAHYSERYTGSEDNGGVHINSGIPNKAFHLFATNSSVGKDKAEQVYYRALSMYLVKSSNFVDCRNAVVQAATDLYGASVANVAKAAFDAVGIGAGSGSNNQNDIPSNPGDDYILLSDSDYSQLYIFTPDGQGTFNPLTTTSPISRPSVTDDGEAVVFISNDNKMRALTINWATGNVNEQVIQSESIWRNVAISKDGERLAALTTDYDNQLWIYDYGLGIWQTFELFNPTTGQGGPTTGDVQYADVLEWDLSNQWVMYDALNTIKTTGGFDIDYWDISFIRVWGGSDFSNGYVEKLFSSLPEDVSVGNPAFSKNSDYIIAFDYVDDYEEEYYLMGANIEENDVATIFQNLDLSWPNYSIDDKRLVFDAEATDGTPVLAFISLNNDKISPSGSASIYIEQGRWGVWFANGDRILGVEDFIAEKNIRLYPNPVSENLNLEFTTEKTGEAQLQVFDLVGRQVLSEKIQAFSGKNQRQLGMSNLPGGQYFLRLNLPDGQAAMKVVKN